MSLVLQDSIVVDANHGTCLIELLFGSITTLSKEQAVDIIIVSAFPGNYAPTPTSVIGALQRDLNISVRKLAQDKQEDLRKLFSCWYSKELPTNQPFKRLLCFEGSFKIGQTPPMVVSELFRALVSLCEAQKYTDLSVIMPVLASGEQGYSDELMMRLIVDSAVNWMLAGLHLSLLKLVVYCDAARPNLQAQNLHRYFGSLKEIWAKQLKNRMDEESYLMRYDIYLSYSMDDAKFASVVEHAFRERNKSLRIYTNRQIVNAEESWQGHIYEVMLTCVRVIPLLSRSFLQDVSCVEQYNIALCCSRNMKRDYLAPLYISEVTQMPTYMCLIQYIDCRPCDEYKITGACSDLATSLIVAATRSDNSPSEKAHAASPSSGEGYDVFISYAHKDSDKVERLLEMIKVYVPKWQVFFDQSGLKVGTAWQTKLYNSIENSKSVIAFLSPNYLASKVCQEEFNLAMALSEDPNYSLFLLPVQIADVPAWPVWCRSELLVDCQSTLAASSHARDIVNIVQTKSGMKPQMDTAVLPLSEILAMWRRQLAEFNYPVVADVDLQDSNFFADYKHHTKDEYDVMVSCHATDSDFASYFTKQLRMLIPGVRVSEPVLNRPRLHELDGSKIVVPFLSKAYTKDALLMDELGIALYRHRFAECLVLCPIVVSRLPLSPAFAQIVFCLFSCVDTFWKEYPERQVVDSDRASLEHEAVVCLDRAALFVANLLAKRPDKVGALKTLLSIREMQSWVNAANRSWASGEVGDLKEISATPSGLFFWETSPLSHAMQYVLKPENVEESESEKTVFVTSAPSIEKQDVVSTEVASDPADEALHETSMNQHDEVLDPRDMPCPGRAKAKGKKKSLKGAWSSEACVVC